MKEAYSAKEIAQVLGITERSVQRRANKEAWPYRIETTRGGKRKLYLFVSLPDDVQAAIALAERKAGTTLTVNQPTKPELPETIPPWAEEIALARADLVREFLEAKARGGLKKAKQVLSAYNTGELFPKIYAKLGEVSLKTLYRWEKAFREAGYDYRTLAPKWGRHRRGKSKVTPEEAKVLLSLLLHQNKYKIDTAIKLTKAILKQKGTRSPSSHATLRRFAEAFRRQHYDIWVLAREGEKALEDKVLPYIERDASLLEVGDVLVADGHKCNFQVRNPFTGRPCRPTLLVFYDWASRDVAGYAFMLTENIEVVHLALYRAIRRLGKIPKIVYLDNGKAFRAKIFTGDIDFKEEGTFGLYARLGIKTIFSLPYNAKAKVVERFYRTISSFERMLPSFVGTSIEDKPARLLRNEKFMQALAPDYLPELDEVAEWFEGWLSFYRSQSHKGLGGKTPGEIFEAGRGPGVDEVELSVLMMCEKGAQLYRNGVRFLGHWYWHEALYGLKERVVIRYDLHDLRSVLVFTEDGQFLCRAERREKAHPAAAELGDAKSYSEVRRLQAEKMRLKKLTKQIVAAGLGRQANWEEIVARVPEIADDLEQERVAQELSQVGRDQVLTITDDEVAALPEPEQERAETPIFANETERYFWLMDRILVGEKIDEDDRKFIAEYEADPANSVVVSLMQEKMAAQGGQANVA